MTRPNNRDGAYARFYRTGQKTSSHAYLWQRNQIDGAAHRVAFDFGFDHSETPLLTEKELYGS